MGLLAYSRKLVGTTELDPFRYQFSSTMAACFIAGLALAGLSFAHPGSDEALQPCGGAFYYPSKVGGHPWAIANQQLILIVHML